MKIKVSKAEGPSLDWLVALALGAKAESQSGGQTWLVKGAMLGYVRSYNPTTDWEQGGPIIAREDIEFVLAKEGGHHESAKWMAIIRNSWFGFAEDHLTAAMRGYVVSKLGDEVEVPDELGKQV